MVKHIIGDSGTSESIFPGPGRPVLTYQFLKQFYDREKTRNRVAKKRGNDVPIVGDTASEAKKSSILDLLSYKGIGTNCRRMAQYNAGNLSQMISVGLCRSAAGARSHGRPST